MKRRKFLTLAGIGAVGIALPVVGSNSHVFIQHAIVTIIKKDLHYLKLEDKGLKKFAVDIIEYSNRTSFANEQKLRLKISIEYLTPKLSERSEILDYLSSNYLLSTDFFMNKMDESKEVKYVSLFDPYLRPCSNPFSHLYYK